MAIHLAQLARQKDLPEPEGGPDAELVLRRLNASIGRSNWSLADVNELIRRGPPHYVLVDDAEQTMLWGHARPRDREIRILAWLWDGEGDFFARLMPLMFALLKTVIADYPQAAATGEDWAALGNVPGAGTTEAERLADAQRIALNIRTGSTVGVALEEGDQPGYRLVRSRVSEVLAREAPDARR